ncbi:MAG: hypothetical protein OEO82_09925 [Gammaproteobacteria bacterium]|nr:hypothetical protein [Gammaproteobacteria bacterium]
MFISFETVIAMRLLLLALCLVGSAVADEVPAKIDETALEAQGVIIGTIELDKQNVFDTSIPKENNWLYRLANRFHIVTRDRVIDKQLLLEPGDTYSKRLVDESERILRRNSYLYDASITPVNRRDGVVDLRVSTRDVWTLIPTLSVSRKGGENKTTIGLQELNLLGRGQTIRFERTDDVDRTATTFEFLDAHLGRSWVTASLFVADNSDGHSRLLSLIRPFYALDTRWSAGITAFDDDRRTAFYDLGNEAAEFQHDRERFSLFGGWSSGLRGGWVKRYTAGMVYDDNVFSAVENGSLPAFVPANRKLAYPFIGIDLLEDQFETASNRQQIAKTEDFFTGTRLSASLGLASQDTGADRDAIIYTAGYSQGFGSLESAALLLDIAASGRQESGDSRNAVVTFSARYFRKQSDKRLFFATISGTHGHDLDADNIVALGGDTGLRGYPLRYQSGDSKFLATIEQRYYWDWYPFRLVRVGGAIFADVGRTWGRSPIGTASDGWLRDVGIGLRFAPTRTGSRKIAHLDFAFPLDGDASIDNLQIVLEGKRSF